MVNDITAGVNFDKHSFIYTLDLFCFWRQMTIKRCQMITIQNAHLRYTFGDFAHCTPGKFPLHT